MKKAKYIPLLLLLFLFSSCKKWLAVNPEDKVYVDDALKNSAGFQKALAGVYNVLSGEALYGRDMEYGLMDVLAGYWNLGTNAGHEYYQAALYNYQSDSIKTKTEAIWSGLYSGVRQVNIVLDNIDNIENSADFNLIKGEAMGLRAFLHLEALRLFGPVISNQGLDVKAIPYYTSITKSPVGFISAIEALDLIEKDLQDALLLLNQDPIRTLGRTGNGNSSGSTLLAYNSLLDRRGVRMNYYAVKALLARKSLWKGNLTEAATRAEDLINELKTTNAVRMLESTDIESGGFSDIRFTVENIFAILISKHLDYTRNYLVSGSADAYHLLKPEYTGFLENLYTTGTGNTLDYRLIKWTVNAGFFGKYNMPSGVTTATEPRYFEVQLINLPEMYFILAEANLINNPSKAVEFINIVRRARNIPELPVSVDSGVATSYLFDEMRREYLGEGALFTFYKRRYHDIYRYSGNIPASTTVFNLPLPDDEIIYNSIK